MFVEPSTLRVSPIQVTPPPSPARELRVQFRSAVDAVVVTPDVAPEPAPTCLENASSQQPESPVLRIRVE